jgi:hypothetical protein
MSLRWKRVNHWKNIRMLVGADGNSVYAYIQRGRRPNEYTLVFPKETFIWSVRRLGKDRCNQTTRIPDYVLTESSLAVAKTVGMFIVKTQGEGQ